MDVPTDNWIFWLITGIVTLLVTILLILFKRNLFIQTKQQEVTQALTINVTRLTEKLENFQLGCERIEATNRTRLDKHAQELDQLNIKTGQHSVRLDEHDRRIGVLESQNTG